MTSFLATKAQALLREGAVEEATILLDTRLARAPDDADAHHLRGLARHAAGDAAGALLSLARAACLA
ncbi:MAG: hypothetical protein HQL40_10370, partial [Alphaproteobacteria bacterium]|nr:hypothetical protein [Alphaproteobacteria bacterium]